VLKSPEKIVKSGYWALCPQQNKRMNQPLFGFRISAALIALLTCFVLQAPAQQQPVIPPPQSQPPVAPPSSKPAMPQQTSAGAPVGSKDYKVGPTDVLSILVWDQPQFSGSFSVHEDGNITLPLVGDLPAAGKTPDQIAQVVTQALSKYVVKPLVTVTVQEVLSKKYYMDGEIARPGEYPLVAPTTVLEAISKAGGLQEFANAKHIYILRGDKKIRFNYKDVISGKHMDQNIDLKPGDHVVVP
jgi:polysaccharide export outer membrane protein